LKGLFFLVRPDEGKYLDHNKEAQKMKRSILIGLLLVLLVSAGFPSGSIVAAKPDEGFGQSINDENVKNDKKIPQITNPSDNSQVKLEDITVEWKKVPGVGFYFLNLTDETTGTKLLKNTSVESAYTISKSLLAVGHKYRLEITTSYLQGFKKDSIGFSVVDSLPEPVIVNPANNAVLSKGEVVVVWKSVPRATFYRFSLKDETAESRPFDGITVNQTLFTIPAAKLEAGHRYTVFVVACADDITSGRSDLLNFTVNDESKGLPSPVIKSPPNNSSWEVGDLKVSWTVVPGATTYKVNYRDETTGKQFDISITSLTNYTIPAMFLAAGHRYKITIAASRAKIPDSISDPVFFNVITILSPPEIKNPTDRASLDPGDLTVTWKSVPQASSYKFNLKDQTVGRVLFDNIPVTRTNFTIPGSALTAGHSYKVMVAACDPNNADVWSDPVSFRINNLFASTPVLLSPANNSLLNPEDITVKWGNVGGATSYKLNFKDETSGGQPTVFTVPVNRTYYIIPASVIRAGHRYRIEVAACAEDYSDLWSAPLYINIKNMLSGPVIISPENNSYFSLDDIQVVWRNVPDATSYKVIIEDEDSGRNPFDTLQVTQTKAWLPGSSLKAGHRYQVRVAASAANYSDSWSEPIHFRIKDLFPTVPVVKSPTVNYTMNGGNITITWQNVSGAGFYKLNVTDTATGNKIIDNQAVYGTSYTIPAASLPRGHQYKVSVAACASGYIDSWSDPYYWEVSNRLSGPVIISPSGNNALDYGNVMVRWSEVPGATSYQLLLKDQTTGVTVLNNLPVNGSSYLIPVATLIERHNYQVLVAGCTSNYTGDWSSPAYFSIKAISVLSGPVIHHPLPNAVLDPGNIAVEWGMVSNAQTYQLSLRDITTDTLTIFSAPLNSTAYLIPAAVLAEGHQYRVAVAASASGYKDSWSECIFEVKNCPRLPAPTITAPFDGVTLDRTDLRTSWNQVTDATAYSLVLWDLTTGIKLLENVMINSTDYVIPAKLFTAGHEYKVALTATAVGFKEGLSESRFAINQLPVPSLPQIFKPSNIVNYGPVTVAWNSVAGATSYKVALTDVYSGVTHFEKAYAEDYSLPSSWLEEGHFYKITVAAIVPKYPERWSNPSYFGVKSNFSLGTTIIGLADDLTLDYGSIPVAWEGVRGAEYYKLLVIDENTGAKFTDFTKDTNYSVPASFVEAGHEYGMVVAVSSAKGGERWSEPLEFNLNHIFASAPDPVSPSDGAVCEPGEVALTWKAVTGATSYRIEFDDLNSGKVQEINTAQTVYKIPSFFLTRGHEYKIFIVARASGYTDKWSSKPTYFTVKNFYRGKLDQPVISQPSQNSLVDPGGIKVAWNKVPQAEFYQISLVDVNTNTLLIDRETTYGPNYIIFESLLRPGHEYQIMAGAKASDFDSAWSDVSSFMINNFNQGSLTQPKILSPFNNSDLPRKDIKVAWGSVPGAQYYKLTLLKLNSGNGMAASGTETVIDNEIIYTNSYTIRAYCLEPECRYQYTICAFSSDYATKSAQAGFSINGINQGTDNFEAILSQFPGSYRDNLRLVHNKYPNWIFLPDRPGIDWRSFINAENTPGVSLLEVKASPVRWIVPNSEAYVFKGSLWKDAVREVITYYADPRNFLNEREIFQFEKLTPGLVNPDTGEWVETHEGVKAIFRGNLQETGKELTDADGEDLINRYLNIGQDTIYGVKFDLVADGGWFNHQVAKNIRAAWKAGWDCYSGYVKLNSLNSNFVFKIPVFTDIDSIMTQGLPK
jgi:hypothetical protein